MIFFWRGIYTIGKDRNTWGLYIDRSRGFVDRKAPAVVINFVGALPAFLEVYTGRIKSI